MPGMLRKVVTIVAVGVISVVAATMLSPTNPTGSPYASALSGLVDRAQAATGCENKTCFIAPDGNQSKCVDNLGTSCTIQSVHGRGHGRICVTNTCF